MDIVIRDLHPAVIPYSGELSRGKTFCELVKDTIFAGKTFMDCLLCRAKGCHAPNFAVSRIATKLGNLQKFSPSKVSYHTVVEGDGSRVNYCEPLRKIDICATNQL